MKSSKLSFLVLAAVSVLGISVAKADSIKLNDIDTNDCASAQREIMMLNKAGLQIDAQCSPYIQGGYPSDNGNYYDYRLYTTLTVADGSLYSGASFAMNFINSNSPQYALNEIPLLSNSQVSVDVQLSPYIPAGYKSDNGQYYNYRVYTTITVR